MSSYYKTLLNSIPRPFVAVFLLSLLILACAATLKLAVDKLPGESLKEAKFRVITTPYSINFFSNSTDEELFKISPFDDFYYFEDKKAPIYEKQELKLETSRLRKFQRVITKLLFNREDLSWKIRGEQSLNYRVKPLGDGAEITREILAQNGPSSVGQSLVICFNCYVTDDNSRIYFNSDQLTREKLELASRLKLTPVLLTKDQFFPSGISKIKVIDKSGNMKFEVVTNEFQTVLYDEKYRLLELKTFPNEAKNPFVVQFINF